MGGIICQGLDVTVRVLQEPSQHHSNSKYCMCFVPRPIFTTHYFVTGDGIAWNNYGGFLCIVIITCMYICMCVCMVSQTFSNIADLLIPIKILQVAYQPLVPVFCCCCSLCMHWLIYMSNSRKLFLCYKYWSDHPTDTIFCASFTASVASLVKLLLRSMNSVTMVMVAHLHICEIPDEKLICNKQWPTIKRSHFGVLYIIKLIKIILYCYG